MNPIQAHLYAAWESGLHRQLHFRLKQPQANLYKPESWSFKHIVAISRIVAGYSSTTDPGYFRRALLRMLTEGVQLSPLPCALPHARVGDRESTHPLHKG